MGAADTDLLRHENHLLSRFNDREMAVLEMIAEHRPETETLEQICRLVEDTLTGSFAIAVRVRSGNDLDIVASREVPVVLHRAIAANITSEFDRLGLAGAVADLVKFPDPSSSDGRTVWFLPIAGYGELPIAALCVSRDWSEPTKRATDAFNHAARLIQIVSEQTEATRNFVETIAAEREIIANQLHDDPIQSITVLSLRLQRLVREMPDEYRDAILGARTHADQAIERMRRLLFDLHPAELDEDGLTTAIEMYLEEMLEPLGVAWTVDDRLTHVPGTSVSILAFRLTQEALANVASHAEATSVEVSLGDDATTLTIRIADNGRGFDPATIPLHRPGHLGLSNARYLAKQSGGRFDVASSPGAGCTVDIGLPTYVRRRDIDAERRSAERAPGR